MAERSVTYYEAEHTDCCQVDGCPCIPFIRTVVAVGDASLEIPMCLEHVRLFFPDARQRGEYGEGA
jgi:hypothetical protein